MYTVVKCKGCTKIFAVLWDQSYQPYLICPVCGCSFQCNACTPYLECEDRTVAIEIAAKLDELIREREIPELTPEETEILQKEYKEMYQNKLKEKRINAKKENYSLFE